MEIGMIIEKVNEDSIPDSLSEYLKDRTDEQVFHVSTQEGKRTLNITARKAAYFSECTLIKHSGPTDEKLFNFQCWIKGEVED